MRIIAGKFKGRRISPPKSMKSRPTTDYAKEGLFNWLQNILDIEDLVVLDLFSGSGCISLEFVSRGAKQVYSVDVAALPVRFLSQTIQDMGIDNIQPIKGNVSSILKVFKEKVDVVFADPPFVFREYKKLPDQILTQGILNKDGLLILEHPKEHDFSEHPHFYLTRQYGHVHFSLFKAEKD